MKSRIYSLFCIFKITMFSLSCGSGASKDDPGLKPEVPKPEADLAFYGSIYLNDTTTPASDFTLYLVNHSLRTYSSFLTTQAGSFQLPFDNFRRFESYSLHIVDSDHKYIGPVTFNGIDNFVFLGSEQQELGSIVINRDTFGVVDLDTSRLNLSTNESLGVGTGSGKLTDLSFNDDFSEIKLGSHLFIYDPSVLLDAFYRAAANSTKYQASIIEWSGIRISATLAKPEVYKIKSGILTSGSAIVSGGRVLTDEQKLPSKQPSWEQFGRSLTVTDNGIDTVIFPQTIARGSEFVTFDVLYHPIYEPNETSSYDYLGQIGLSLSMPPLITALSQGTPLTSAIDYSSTTDENGLTRPFCRTSGDVYFAMTGPKAFEGIALSFDDFSSVSIQFQYFYEVNGITKMADLETNPKRDPMITSDFPSGLDIPFEDTGLSYAVRSWNPYSQTLTFTYNSNALLAIHQAQIFGDLFLQNIASLNNARITETALRITYDGAKHRTGIISRFKSCL